MLFLATGSKKVTQTSCVVITHESKKGQKILIPLMRKTCIPTGTRTRVLGLPFQCSDH